MELEAATPQLVLGGLDDDDGPPLRSQTDQSKIVSFTKGD
jgi:hypothetical protein